MATLRVKVRQVWRDPEMPNSLKVLGSLVGNEECSVLFEYPTELDHKGGDLLDVVLDDGPLVIHAFHEVKRVK